MVIVLLFVTVLVQVQVDEPAQFLGQGRALAGNQRIWSAAALIGNLRQRFTSAW